MSIPIRSLLVKRILLLLSTTGAMLNMHAQSPVVTLSPSNFNGYNLTCFGAQDGAIDASVSGGTPPYTYLWTNAETTEDLSDLAAGYYKVIVTDANTLTGEAEITLTEPRPIKLVLEPFVYPNKYHISCHECYNGSIDVEVTGGVEPYDYLWRDEVTTQDRSALGAGTYTVVITDANGCEEGSEKIGLRQPERSDWTMSGNEGTDPSEHYIGTSDEQDVVFKSNGQEVLRLKSDGSISLTGDANASAGVLYRMPDGTLKLGGWPPVPPDPADPCNDLSGFPFWETRGNTFVDPLCDEPLLGTMSNHELHVVTNGEERMTITTTGKVGIGTYPPSSSAYRLFVEDGIATRDVLVKLGNWPDYVFDDGYRLMPLSELREFLNQNKHLPTMLSAAQLEEQGGAELGDIQRRLLRTVEEQALYILQLEERLEEMERRLGNLETNR